MSDFYNNKDEKQFSNLLADLKKLPKIEAPENFEFNLMTKIQNNHFGQVYEERPRFNLFKFLAPSAAVLATVILFFIFYPQQQEIQTQITEKQTTIDTQSIAGNASDKDIQSLFNQPEKKKSNNANNPARQNQQNLAQNTQASKQNLMFNQRRSVSVDDYISGTNSSQTTGLRNSVVNSGENPVVDGFYVEKKADKKIIEKYRNELDSLRKAQIKADSLKKARK